MSILYPIAETAEQALNAPLAFAEREREAVQAAGRAVEFVSEAVGPAFASPAAAEEAYHATRQAPGEWRTLRPVLDGKAAPPQRPVMKGGRRWPEPKAAAPTLWRLSVSYWRIVREMAAAPPPTEAARRLRRGAAGEGLDPRALQALARQPLRPVEPQRPLDIGLFEVRIPEAPDRTMPDE